MSAEATKPKTGSWQRAVWCVAIVALLLLTPAAHAAVGVETYWGNVTSGGAEEASGGRFNDHGPNGVAVYEATGDVYVADSGYNRIQQFDADGNFIRAWGFDVAAPTASPASSAGFETCTERAQCKSGVATGVLPVNGLGGELSNPSGIAVDQATGNVYVSDVGFNRVQEFSSEGTFLRAFGQDVVGSGPDDSGSGYEICVAGADTCKAGGTTGSTGGVLGAPGYLTVAPQGAPNQGDVLVTDPSKNRVQEFTSAGDFVRTFGAGVIGGGAEGTGTLNGTETISAVKATNEAFAIGQTITSPGGGIQPGTVIVAVSTGAASTIKLSKPATSSESNAVLRVAEGTGNVPNNEKQLITLGADTTGGTFAITMPATQGFAAATTAPIAWDASPAAVEAALIALAPIGAGNVEVTSSNPGGGVVGGPYEIEFKGKFADTNVANLTTSSAGLTGGTATRTTTIQGASGYEVCVQSADCQGGVAGVAAGQFASGEVKRIAEDPSGNIYTVETALGSSAEIFRVQKFTLPGNVPAPQGTFDCADLCGTSGASTTHDAVEQVGVDGQGFVYAAKPFLNGQGNPPVEPNTPSTELQERVLKIDPAADGGNGEVVETILVNTGAEPGVEGDQADDVIAGISGLAPMASGSQLFLATAFIPYGDAGRSRVYRLGEISGPGGSASTAAVGATAATLSATVSPAATLGPVKTFYRFEYRREGTTGWIQVPSTDVDIGNGSAGGESNSCSALLEAATCHVSGEIDGLELGRTYQYRLVARTSYQGAVLTTAPQEFTTTATPPSVAAGSGVWSGPPATGPSLTFNGTVNPQGANTDYAFEYVTQAGFEASGFAGARTAPAAPAGAGHGTKTIDVVVSKDGLDPSSGYEFRLLATNPAGTSTASPAFVAPAHAGDRFLELVTAGDSQGGDVSSSLTISDDGERAAFSAISFGPEQQASNWIVNPAISQRGTDGWSATAVAGDPSHDASGSLAQVGGTGDAAVTGRLWGTRPEPQTVQWAVRKLDGALTSVSPVLSPLDRTGDFSLEFQGGSPDLSTLVFANAPSASSTLFPDEPLLPAGASDLYEVTGAGTASPAVSLLNRAADGTAIGGACGAVLGSGQVKDGAISQDGSVAYFSARAGTAATGSCKVSGTGQTTAGSSVITVFTVISGSFAAGQAISGPNIPAGAVIEAVGSGNITISAPATGSGFAGILGKPALEAGFPLRIFKRSGTGPAVEVSACAKPSPGSCSGGDDSYWGASGDGSKVFFTTARQLTASDIDMTEDLYVYDSSPPAGQPDLVQASLGDLGEPAEVEGVVDYAMDGSRVYFVASGRLTSEATAGANNLYVYERDAAHPAGRLAFVATLAPGAFSSGGGESDPRLWAANSNSQGGGKPAYALPRYESGGASRVDGDGHLLVFVSSQRLLPAEDQDSANDVYRYDDDSGRLECLSCAGNANFPVNIIGRDVSSDNPDQIQRERVANEDGSEVAFATKDQLLPSDTNTSEDVYLWDEGALSLISGATGGTGVSYFEGGGGPSVSPDGNSVFFLTRATLLPQDLDNGARDVYVARVDGGFRQQETTVPCSSAEACHGVARAEPPPGAVPGSAGFVGPGNASSPPPCPKRKVRRHGKCVKRPVRHRHRKHHKHRHHRHKEHPQHHDQKKRDHQRGRSGSERRTGR